MYSLVDPSAPPPPPQAAVNQANMDDDALEELSVSREPRSRDSNSITRSVVDQLPKFSEWAAGRQGSLDGDTLSKHVRQMVDVSVCVGGSICILTFLHILWSLPCGDAAIPQYIFWLTLFSQSINCYLACYRLCFELTTVTTVVRSALKSLTPSPPTFPSLSTSLFSTRTSELLIATLYIMGIHMRWLLYSNFVASLKEFLLAYSLHVYVITSSHNYRTW